MRILVLGATGMLGHRMMATLWADHEVYGVCRSDSVKGLSLFHNDIPANIYKNIDVLSLIELERVFESVCPDAVLNCVGILKIGSINIKLLCITIVIKNCISANFTLHKCF